MTQLEVINISHNKLKEFPMQLSYCSNLRVIDVSHNLLTSFPADLALKLHDLQSFLVNGNTAAESEDIPYPYHPQKRQKRFRNSII